MKFLNTLILFILFITDSCAQPTKRETIKSKEHNNMYSIDNYINDESKHITKKNYVEEIMKKVKHYPEEPIYYLRINKQNCIIDVLINDIRRLKDYELSNYITPLEIGGQILKSGTQSITIRMYPVKNLINESLGKEGPSIDTLLSNSSVAISVIQIDNRSEKKTKDEVLVTQNISPSKDGKFVGAGLPDYEHSFTFEAKVPYELEGWTKGQDLRKLDQKKLEQKALEFYKMVQQIYVNKDLEKYLKLNFSSDYRIYSSLYESENIISDEFNKINESFTFDYTPILLEPYKLSIEGNGKLVKLICINKEPFYRGKLAGGLKFIDNDGDEALLNPGITLYLPEGRSLDEGLMMWK